MAVSATVLSNLSSALGALASEFPGGLLRLGSHLTSADEVQALDVLNSMAANPPGAASLLPELTALKTLPPTVMEWVNQAIGSVSNPAVFENYVAQAKAALISAATNTGALGSIF